MSEPSTNIPGDVADAQVDETSDTTPETPEKVELVVDEEKLEAWDEVKSDYQVDPDADTRPADSRPAGAEDDRPAADDGMADEGLGDGVAPG